MPEHSWFEIDEPDELTETERAFVTALREQTADFASDDTGGEVTWCEDRLVAYLTVIDPEAPLSLIDFGVHFSGDRVQGDRLHNQLLTLPDQPSGWALDETGTVQELARRSTRWFHAMLRRPVMLYVWLHNGYAYAARYVLADTDETISQCYNDHLAPPGQAEELIAAGHVHGKNWIQTVGLPVPDLYLHIRGNLDEAAMKNSRAATKRGPITGVWYE
ncbi:hypothetical protein [Microbispora sp. KK1-11]|uniref:hypothetical protein n=1 Tax=Microbispora sp. KK1-11 TaxID=2053005 RepID=UPI00115B54CF|nr:hypothetical protein [Microbispora sp. KK1-11]TQS25294.1 hypothetical protein FLW16_31555 [Microbispora sp. KK1-11]